MNGVYWQPRRISLWALVAICLLSLAGVGLSERCVGTADDPVLEAKLEAAQLAQRSMGEIKAERLRRGHQFDPKFDPAASGMIGEFLTPVTSLSGHLESKQTSVNPNFAAAVVEMLHEVGVGSGDVVAVGCSGSFPALNLCVCAALETMHARPVIIASASASQFGANMPDLLWIDMERILHERGCISFRSAAASYGGYEDRALGSDAQGRELIQAAIERNHLSLIRCDGFTESIDERMKIYREHAGGRPIKAYVNIGGGTVSVGRSLGKKLYRPGLNVTASPKALRVDSVMSRFMRDQVPVIHLVSIPALARRLGFPIAPATTPKPGEGAVFRRHGRNPWVARGMLLLIGVLLAATTYERRGSEAAPFDPSAGADDAHANSEPLNAIPLRFLSRAFDRGFRRGLPRDRHSQINDHAPVNGSRAVFQHRPK